MRRIQQQRTRTRAAVRHELADAQEHRAAAVRHLDFDAYAHLSEQIRDLLEELRLWALAHP